MAVNSHVRVFCNNLDCEYNDLDSDGRGFCTTEEVILEKDEEENCDDLIVCWKCGLGFNWKNEHGLVCPYCEVSLTEEDVLGMGPYIRIYCKKYKKLRSKRNESGEEKPSDGDNNNEHSPSSGDSNQKDA